MIVVVESVKHMDWEPTLEPSRIASLPPWINVAGESIGHETHPFSDREIIMPTSRIIVCRASLAPRHWRTRRSTRDSSRFPQKFPIGAMHCI